MIYILCLAWRISEKENMLVVCGNRSFSSLGWNNIPHHSLQDWFLSMRGRDVECITCFFYYFLLYDWMKNQSDLVEAINLAMWTIMTSRNACFRYLPQNILGIIYNSLILPHNNYSVLVWVFKSSRISKLQKSAVRTISIGNIMHTLSRYLNLWTF